MGQTVQDVIELLSEIPPFPKAVSKLIQLLSDDKVTAAQLGQIISSDPALTLKVLHVANSPFYMCSRRINSVDEAVIVLGVNTLKSISTGIGFQNGLRDLIPPSHVCNMSDFWRHSFATAIASRQLAKGCRDVDEDIAYVAGLVHDVGRIVQAKYWPESWKAAVTHLKNTPGSFHEVESQYFGFNSYDITYDLCERWGFPQPFMKLLARVPATGEICDEDVNVGTIKPLAESLAHLAGFNFPAESVITCAETVKDRYSEIIESLDEEVSYQLRMLE